MDAGFSDRAIAAAIEASLAEAEQQKQLEEVLERSKTDVAMRSQKKKIMFLGGSREVDPERRIRFANYNAFTTGDHSGADVRGDWNSPRFWAEIKQRSPDIVVIDSGSESWLQKGSPALTELIRFLKINNTILMFAPHYPGSDWLHEMFSQHFNVVRFGGRNVLFTFWPGLPERPEPYPSEILKRIHDCEMDRNMTPEEKRFCYESLNLIENFPAFDDAVEYQLEILSGM